MLQKELAKRLKARYDTKMDGNEWLEVSSDGIPLCRIKYNGQFLSNADKNPSDEYRNKILDIQEEISTVREYVGLYEHAPQMQAADAPITDSLPPSGIPCWRQPTVKRTALCSAHGNRMQTATRCSGEITRRTMNICSKSLHPNTRRLSSERQAVGEPPQANAQFSYNKAYAERHYRAA